MLHDQLWADADDVTATMMESEVRLQLKKDEVANTALNNKDLPVKTASSFLTIGLELEEMQ